MRPIGHLHRRTLAILVSVIVFPAFAHHGDAGRFVEEVIDVTGTVVTLMFINPHSQLIVDVADENSIQVFAVGNEDHIGVLCE